MTIINGSDIEIFSGRASDPRCFVCENSKAQIHELAKSYNIAPEKISRMLVQACDPDVYRHDMWRTVVGGFRFTFHISRLKVELRRAERV